MNRVGGSQAVCDQDGCEAKHQIARGDDPEWSLDWAGWEVRSEWTSKLADPDVMTLCPTHKAGGF